MLKVPLEWLKEFVAIRLDERALAHRLTMAGFEVTGIEQAGGGPVFSLEITPNRADCLSILGIAREVAAVTGARLKLAPGSRLQARKRRPPASSLEPRAPLVIRIEDRAGCKRYIGRLIEGVKVGPSPDWMVRRLGACGLRPINNIVDITNYVLLECGQPLHAFDFQLLRGGALIVRRARDHEQILALDGHTYTLRTSDLVIADADRPVAVAGVMGGQDTAVTERTHTILLESAWFDPVSVRRTGRGLGPASESSYRFERGVDFGGVETASRRAASLILELAGGRETAVQRAGDKDPRPTVVAIDPSLVQRRLGGHLSAPSSAHALATLGFGVKRSAAVWRVSVPSYRRDVTQDVDLIEEIARLIGYDRLPETPLCAARGQRACPAEGGVESDRSYARTLELRRLCASLGLSEVMTWSLISEAELTSAAIPFGGMRLINPLSRDHSILRPTLLVGMLRATSKNYAQGASGARLFEIGRVFKSNPPARELLRIGMMVSGVWEQTWQGKKDADLFRVKGVVDALIRRASGASMTVRPAAVPWAELGASMQIELDGELLGAVGQVGRQVCAAFEIEKPVWYAELDADRFLAQAKSAAKTVSPSLFPPVKRDVSFLVDRQAACAELTAFIRATGGALAVRVDLIDRYDGAQVPKNKQSLTFSIEYRDPSRTLTAAEVDVLHRRIGEGLVQRFGAQLR